MVEVDSFSDRCSMMGISLVLTCIFSVCDPRPAYHLARPPHPPMGGLDFISSVLGPPANLLSVRISQPWARPTRPRHNIRPAMGFVGLPLLSPRPTSSRLWGCCYFHRPWRGRRAPWDPAERPGYSRRRPTLRSSMQQGRPEEASGGGKWWRQRGWVVVVMVTVLLVRVHCGASMKGDRPTRRRTYGRPLRTTAHADTRPAGETIDER